MDEYYVVKIERYRKAAEGERYREPSTVFSVHVTEACAAIIQEAIMTAMLNPPKPVEKVVVR